MKAQEKYSKKSLVSNVVTYISILLFVNVANSYTKKEVQSEFCVNKECSTLNPTDEIENAMQATAASIHLWSGNRSYKSLLKAIIISSAENRVGKIVEINHHLLAMSLDVGNIRMARESVSIINRFAPQSLERFNQARLFNDGTPALTMFQRLNLNSKFSNREIDLINNNFQIRNNEYLIGNDSFNSENSEFSGEEIIVDGIYDLTNDGTGEVFFYTNKQGNRTNTLFSKLRDKMSQLSYSKSGCRLRYIALIREAVVIGASGAATIGATLGNFIAGPPGALVAGSVAGVAGGILHGYNTSDKEKIELEKCNDGADDDDKKMNTETPTSNEQKEKAAEQTDSEEDDDDKKRHTETTVITESPNADLQDTSTSSTEQVDLLRDYYNTINYRQFDNYSGGTLTFEEMQIEINSIVNFGNKESDLSGMSAAELVQQAIQEQERWTTPVKPLKQSLR